MSFISSAELDASLTGDWKIIHRFNPGIHTRAQVVEDMGQPAFVMEIWLGRAAPYMGF